MTKITIDRAVVEQALEALDEATGYTSCPTWSPSMTEECKAAASALRAALAEHYCDTHCTWADHAPGCVRAEPVQEPVAWMYTGIKQDGTEHGPHLVWKPAYMDAMSAEKGAKATPLYTAPPQRKPLAAWQITDLMADIDPEDVCSWTFRQGVYAAEKHHGIKP